MATAKKLFGAAFAGERTPRSAAYKAGVLAALRYWLNGAGSIRTPFEAGTAEADAFFAGVDEGCRIARQHISEQARCRTGQAGGER